MSTLEIKARIMVVMLAIECMKTPNPVLSYLLIVNNVPRFE